ncbi:MAG: methyltransferase domain-containing protein [Myxococcota bacterium]
MVLRDLSKRSFELELMDDPNIEGRELEETVEHVERVNRLTFGGKTSIRGFESLVSPTTRKLSVLDVGAGNGGIAMTIADWAEQRSIDANIDGIDLNDTIVDYANRKARGHGSVQFEVRNLFDVPDDASYDVVHASLMLHHLDDEAAVEALAKMRRIARLGVIITDLHRHPLAWAAIKSTIRLISGNRLVRNDAPLSVARAFTRDELDALARRAGFEHHSIAWEFAFRWLMVAPVNHT